MFDDLGLPFEVIPADIDEEMKPDESPQAFVRRAAGEKGRAVANRLRAEGPNRWIVSADTVVVLGEKVLCNRRIPRMPGGCYLNCPVKPTRSSPGGLLVR